MNIKLVARDSGLVIRDKKGTKAEGTLAQRKKTWGVTSGLHENLRFHSGTSNCAFHQFPQQLSLLILLSYPEFPDSSLPLQFFFLERHSF
jgi:hypothetical protein